jgi:acetylornithine/N-succinyldiaminopimelate aminotransferase
MLKNLDENYVLQTYARQELNIVKGVNATLYDDNNKMYIDFTSGIGVVSIGHGNEKLSNAISEQVKKMIHISNLYLIEPQAKCAQKIVELSGMKDSENGAGCFFGNSGAEANEGAIKIARKYGEINGETKRYKIITLEHSFHGRTITTVKATGQESMHNYFGPFPDGFVYAESIEQIESLIDDHTVAVMIELVQGEGGVQPLEREAVKSLAAMLKQKDILLIVDEVQTGVYRTGEFLAANLYDIEPDIVTLAKGLGGGVPIGVVMTTHKDILHAGDHGSTFGGNYLSTTAALTVMEELEQHKDSGSLDHTCVYFEKKLSDLSEEFSDIFTSSVGFGLMRGLRVRDAKTLSDIIVKSRKNGLLILKAGRNTLRFLPPLTITKEEIDEGFKRLSTILATF